MVLRMHWFRESLKQVDIHSRTCPVSGSSRVPTTVPCTVTGASEFREGWDFLRRDSVLVGVVTILAVTNLLDQAWSTVLVPVWTRENGYGAELVGAMFAAFAACSIGGSVLAASLGERLPRMPVYILAFVLCGFPRFCVYAIDSPILAVLVILGLSGFASGFINPILGAVVFERIPQALVGRVTSLNSALCWTLIPFGGLVGGAVVSLTGVKIALATLGTAYLVTTLAPLCLKSFRGFNNRVPTESSISR